MNVVFKDETFAMLATSSKGTLTEILIGMNYLYVDYKRLAGILFCK